MDADLIEKAAELDRRFNEVATTVGTALKTAIVESATALQEFVNAFQGMWSDFQTRRNAVALGEQLGSLAGTTGGGSIPQTVTTPKTDRLPRAEFVPPTPPAGGFGSLKPGGKRDASAAAALREAEAVRDLIAELERELSLVGATDLEREISNALRDAGAAATDEQRAKIVALVTALEAEEAAMRNATEAADELRSIGRDVLGGLIQDLRGGATAAEALTNALSNVADRLLNIGLDALFGGTGIGAIFGFADGGIAKNGKPLKRFARGGVSKSAAIFGEAGAEAAVPLPDGRRIPVDLRVPQVPAGGGSTTNINMPVTISAPGADPAALARVREEVVKLQKSIPQRVDQRLNDRQVRKTRA
jgi:hypothetical protein